MRVVITGSSSGIGKIVAEKLRENGHEVWGLARRRQARLRPQRPEATCGYLRSSVCDVSKWASVKKAALAIDKEWGGINALITCAARQGVIGPTVTLDPNEWSETVCVTLDGTLNSIVGFFPLLRKSPQRAKVICFSGGGATSPRPNFSAYAAAKAGVVRLVETLAEEWRDFQIDINAVAPGALPTQMTAEILALGPEGAGSKEYAMAEKTTSAGLEAFEKICALIAFLLSPQSDGITGRLISAPWDSWQNLGPRKVDLAGSDVFTLRRITPQDRGMTF
jgi:NAD(P)-dependent dehydrogenase (short-subunit alcohol dehydrogenase family)